MTTSTRPDLASRITTTAISVLAVVFAYTAGHSTAPTSGQAPQACLAVIDDYRSFAGAVATEHAAVADALQRADFAAATDGRESWKKDIAYLFPPEKGDSQQGDDQ